MVCVCCNHGMAFSQRNRTQNGWMTCMLFRFISKIRKKKFFSFLVSGFGTCAHLVFFGLVLGGDDDDDGAINNFFFCLQKCVSVTHQKSYKHRDILMMIMIIFDNVQQEDEEYLKMAPPIWFIFFFFFLIMIVTTNKQKTTKWFLLLCLVLCWFLSFWIQFLSEMFARYGFSGFEHYARMRRRKRISSLDDVTSTKKNVRIWYQQTFDCLVWRQNMLKNDCCIRLF